MFALKIERVSKMEGIISARDGLIGEGREDEFKINKKRFW